MARLLYTAYRQKSSSPGTTVSAPSRIRKRSRSLLASGEYLTKISPTIPTLGAGHLSAGTSVKERTISR